MGKVIFTALVLFISWYAQAQDGIGIGTTSPHSSAILDVESKNKNKGLLLPRITTLPTSAADGLVVYNENSNSLYARENGGWYDVFPHGGIIMWSGNPNSLPEGWALCDGRWYDPKNSKVASQGSPSGTHTVQTPDLKGRFIAGYSGSGDYASVGNTGGTAQLPSHSHSLPSHNHNVSVSVSTNGSHNHSIHAKLDETSNNSDLPSYPQRTHRKVKGGNGVDYSTGSAGSHSHTATVSEDDVSGTSGSTGSGTANENRPPYYVLAFIMKL